MKKLAVLLILLALPAALYAWGSVGHATVARIAYDHLTPKARKALLEATGGIPITAIASDADSYRPFWTSDIGFIPSNAAEVRPENVSYLAGFDYSSPANIEPYPHCITIRTNGESYRDIREGDLYVQNAAWYVEDFSKKLKEGSLDAGQTRRAIALIVHFLGDMHCPVHICYDSETVKLGRFKISYKGRKMNLHAFWDKEMLAIYPGSFGDIAGMADVCSRKEIKALCAGTVYDWAEDSGRCCREAATGLIPDTRGTTVTIDKNYPREHRDLLFSQLRKAGYRLAHTLNGIYK